ncbi:MAG: GIY-YIG nuclease family protein [Parachlamydia sp.]|nr:GIY-YIG nuclease family protein [Parachlamydia sp.]
MANSGNWEVYMIQAKSGKLYTGITNNLDKRFDEHVKKRKGARFFRFSSPDAIVLREAHHNRSEASKRENAIKKMTRQQKLALIQQNRMEVSPLSECNLCSTPDSHRRPSHF